jgi:metal-responsive CopG/Arc/MetJ family transcriptional regulator
MSNLMVVCFKAEPELIEQLDRLAVARKTNRSALIRMAIINLLKEYEAKNPGVVETKRLRIW